MTASASNADDVDDPPFPDDTLSKGWRFELHMEKVKKSDTWLRARTGFVRAHLLLLWSEAWEQTPCGTLPDDDELVALLLDMEPETFAKHRTILMRGWRLASNGRLYHETITERVLAMLDKRKSDAQRTAASRARRNGQHSNHDGDTRMSHVTPGGQMGEFDTKHQAPSTSTSTSTSTSSSGNKEQGESSSSGQGPDGAEATAKTAKARKHHGSDEDHRAARWMFDKILSADATAKEPNWDSWANDVRLMREQDDRQHRDMCSLFGWAQSDGFWRANILSPGKLREKWQQLSIKRQSSATTPAAAGRQPAMTDEQLAAKNAEQTALAKTMYRERFGPPANDPNVIDAETTVVPDNLAIGGAEA